MDSGIESENVSHCKNCNNCGEDIANINNTVDKCSKWLESCSLDNGSVCSDLCETSSGITDSTDNSKMDSGFVFENEGVVLSNKVLCQNNNGETQAAITLQKEVHQYDSINIYKSKKVHIGDITYIKGPVVIKNITKTERDISSQEPNYNSTMAIPRTNWLAQPPLQRKLLDGPAKFVIIGHTASEEGFTQAANTLLVRLTQTFHIESRGWDDIAYNFLIGSDGNAYEGRGYGVVGAHTRHYNTLSIGISFIGCFLSHLPPRISLQKAKALIEYGLSIGAISPDYILLAHCQCSAVESPGKRLFEEIKNWDHWDDSISANNPPPSIEEIIERAGEFKK